MENLQKIFSSVQVWRSADQIVRHVYTEDESFPLIPIASEEAVKNEVFSKLLPIVVQDTKSNFSVNLNSGFIQIGKKVDVLALSQSEELLEKGLIHRADLIKEKISLKMIHLQIDGEDIFLEVFTGESRFFHKNLTDEHQTLTLQFNTAFFHRSESESIHIRLHGRINLALGCVELRGEYLANNVINQSTSAEKNKLDVKILGYILHGYRQSPRKQSKTVPVIVVRDIDFLEIMYFNRVVECPTLQEKVEILPIGEAWENVSDTFLNGFINVCSDKPPVAAFLLNYCNTPRDWLENTGDITYRDINGALCRFSSSETKLSAFNIVNNGAKLMHTKLDLFEDDVVLLMESSVLDSTRRPIYWLFWYSWDRSNCLIGRFSTDEDKEVIVSDLSVWLHKLCVDKSSFPAWRLPNSFFNGWMSY